jgi:hypothetical protein
MLSSRSVPNLSWAGTGYIVGAPNASAALEGTATRGRFDVESLEHGTMLGEIPAKTGT